MDEVVEREWRLRNLNNAVGIGLEAEAKRNISVLRRSLNVDQDLLR